MHYIACSADLLCRMDGDQFSTCKLASRDNGAAPGVLVKKWNRFDSKPTRAATGIGSLKLSAIARGW
jgi:hypothetical protein